MKKRILTFVALATIASSCSTQSVTKETASTPEVDTRTAAVDATVAKGKTIAEKLEEDSDYWHIVKMNPDGTASVSKSIYMEWGGEQVVMIPRSSWETLSDPDQKALAKYVSTEEGTKKIIVGEIRQSQTMPGRNTLSVDETVWESPI
jgi:hypothetical protein